MLYALPLVCLCIPFDAATAILDGSLFAAQQTAYMTYIQVSGALLQLAGARRIGLEQHLLSVSPSVRHRRGMLRMHLHTAIVLHAEAQRMVGMDMHIHVWRPACTCSAAVRMRHNTVLTAITLRQV